MNARLNLTCLISNIRRTVEAYDKELTGWGDGKGQETGSLEWTYILNG